MPSQQVLEEKSSEVDAIKDILKEYKSIGIASCRKFVLHSFKNSKRPWQAKFTFEF